MSNEIQRFTLYVYREAADMEPDESGEWVRYGDVADLLSRTPSPDVEGWISVEDRLPEPCEEGTQVGITASYIVLAASVDGVVGTAWVDYLADPPVWRGCDDCEEVEITHWMPLPDPPKGDE